MAAIMMSPQRLKLFSKAMKVLNQFCKEMNILWQPEGITIQALDEDMRGFFELKFEKDSFLKYECATNVTCRVSVFSMVTFLGHHRLHREVRHARLEFKPEECRIEAELLLEHCRSRRVKISIIAAQVKIHNLARLANKTAREPTFKCSPATLGEVWSRLMNSTEITMWFKDRKILLKNFVEPTDHNYYSISITEYGVPTEKLYSYNCHIPGGFWSTFDLKSCLLFRQLACVNNDQITAYFQRKKDPIELSLQNTNEHYYARIRVISIDVEDNLIVEPNISVPVFDSQANSLQSQSQFMNQSLDYPFTQPTQTSSEVRSHRLSFRPNQSVQGIAQPVQLSEDTQTSTFQSDVSVECDVSNRTTDQSQGLAQTPGQNLDLTASQSFVQTPGPNLDLTASQSFVQTPGQNLDLATSQTWSLTPIPSSGSSSSSTEIQGPLSQFSQNRNQNPDPILRLEIDDDEDEDDDDDDPEWPNWPLGVASQEKIGAMKKR